MRTWQRQAMAMLLVTGLGVSAWAADATIDQVYQAAAHGQLEQAQQMMTQVLRDHPRSGKAHYVEAELLARQGLYTQARTELSQAEALAPGLPFAKPSAVSELRAQVARASNTGWSVAPQASPPASPSLPWGWIVGAVALAGLGWVWWRSRQPSVVVERPFGAVPGAWSPSPAPTGPYPGYGGLGGGLGAPASGGLGSQMLGGLATGAAVGAGVVAGEALMHRVLGDGPRDTGSTPMANPLAGPVLNPVPNPVTEAPAYDMGGQDFGLNDAGGWDDGGSAGGDDWS